MSSRRDEIMRVIREVVAPLIRADGGQVYLVNATADAVSLHLTGRFSGCPGNTLAKRRVIEPAIFAVAPGTDVTVTSGVLIPAGAELVRADAK
ncbi:MAG TPA: NifU family protein [Polyangiaceae bacterium]